MINAFATNYANCVSLFNEYGHYVYKIGDKKHTFLGIALNNILLDELLMDNIYFKNKPILENVKYYYDYCKYYCEFGICLGFGLCTCKCHYDDYDNCKYGLCFGLCTCANHTDYIQLDIDNTTEHIQLDIDNINIKSRYKRNMYKRKNIKKEKYINQRKQNCILDKKYSNTKKKKNFSFLL